MKRVIITALLSETRTNSAKALGSDGLIYVYRTRQKLWELWQSGPRAEQRRLFNSLSLEKGKRMLYQFKGSIKVR